MLYKPYLRKFEYPKKYREYVTASAEKFGVDEHLIYSVIKAESKFDEDARSHKDAQGLMQITPETAGWAMEKMGIEGDIFTPEINIAVGSWYLAKLILDHDGNLTAALAAYNAGSTNVNQWKNDAGGLVLDDILFEETRDYVYKTLKYYENYKKLYTEGE
ncbi:MAG: lytic transglycosylase domain-containing protein [Clostridia bacterium]|nr:lytic transglycosylase domain-containing protein [Clostridia bacterium]